MQYTCVNGRMFPPSPIDHQNVTKQRQVNANKFTGPHMDMCEQITIKPFCTQNVYT